MALAATCLLLYLFARPVTTTNWGEFGLFLGMLVVAELKPVLLPKVRVAHSVSFIIVVVAIIRMPPEAATLAVALSAFVPIQGQVQKPSKLVFNFAQYAVSGGVAALTYRGLLAAMGVESSILARGTLSPVILATAVATIAYFLVNSLAVSGVLAIANKSRFLPTWMTGFGWNAGAYFAFGASGLVLAALYQLVGVSALPLLLVPLLVARGAFRSYQEVREAYESTVRAFVDAIEAKDIYTRGHSERVAEYGRWVAERLGIRDSDLAVFYYGALLHDVGKLVIRKSVLTKPSGLTDEEWEEIKLHPGLGAQIVQDIDFLKPAVGGVLYHHERLDGSGYPAGLKGDLVPFWARILGVVDTYDAMTSTRAYRGARTKEEAIIELQRCSGSMYDPKCVDAFIDALADQEPKDLPQTSYEPQVAPSPAA